MQDYDALYRTLVAYLASRPGLAVHGTVYMSMRYIHVQVNARRFMVVMWRSTVNQEVTVRVSAEESVTSGRMTLRHQGGAWRIRRTTHHRLRCLLRTFRVSMVEDIMVSLLRG